MGWPRNDKPTNKTHWPSRELNALGLPQPACKHIGGFHSKPVIVKTKGDVTCERCMRLAWVNHDA